MASNLERWSASGRLGATPAGGWCSCRRCGRPVVAAHRSWTYTVLRTSVFDEVCTYGIAVTWRTYFTHLGRMTGNHGDWCGWGGSAQAQCRRWWAPGLLRLNWGHLRGRRPSVKLLGRSIWLWRAGSGVAMAKMAARVGARLGWGKPLRTTPYIGRLVPTTCNRCGLQSYAISVLIRSRFGWRSRGGGGISLKAAAQARTMYQHREEDRGVGRARVGRAQGRLARPGMTLSPRSQGRFKKLYYYFQNF
jgi:hypothetical protein